VNVEATIAAIAASMEQICFAEVLLFTDSRTVQLPGEVQVKTIAPLRSGRSYSEFLLNNLAPHVRTEHCLIVQWDGFVLDARQWKSGFLDFDYIGALWPQFDDGHNIGNGGFSLRSRRLLEACASERFSRSHPEDVAICRLNRNLLEQEYGIRFADRKTADRFSFERSRPSKRTFGFHGIFNMISAIGEDRFWEIYRTLDDRRTAYADYRLLMRQIAPGPHGLSRRLSLTFDRAKALLPGSGRGLSRML
jgi:hypothetical protein